MNSPLLHLVAWGALTPLGDTARESAYCYRAGMSGLSESAWSPTDEQAPTIARVPTLDPLLGPVQRLISLCRGALDDMLVQAQTCGALNTQQILRVHILLDEDLPEDLVAEFSRQATAELQQWFVDRYGRNPQFSLYTSGAAGIAPILQAIHNDIQKARCTDAVICSIHSDHDEERLQRLAAARRIHSAQQLDGLLLGEASVALHLAASASTYGRVGESGQLILHEPQLQFEEATPDNHVSAFRAAGLTVSARNALIAFGAQARPLGWVSSDASFETLRTHEITAVTGRLQKYLKTPNQLEFPNQRIGYLGATIGPWQIAYAAEAWKNRFAPAQDMLALQGSDSGARSAFILSWQANPNTR